MTATPSFWKPEFDLDIGVVDGQHRHILTCCQQLVHMAAQGREQPVDRWEIVRGIHELRSYAMFHFHSEEDMLARHGYAGLFEHITVHDTYIDKMRIALKRLADIPVDDKDTLLNLADEIGHWSACWWERHILRLDAQYADFVREMEREVLEGS